MLAEVQQHGTLTEDEAMDAITEVLDNNKTEEQNTLEGVEEGEKEETQAIKPTTLDEVGDFEKAVQINQDKLANLKDEVITKALDDMTEIQDQRLELNARVSEITARLKNLGIPPAAFKAALARHKMGDKKRAEQDAAYSKCTKAMKVGFTPGLF